MLSIVLKKGGLQFLRIMSSTSRLSRFRVPGLLAVGFFVGVAINQLGFVMEGIHVHVELVNSDKTSSPHSTLHDLMQKLPHLNQSLSSKYIVPNIVHYFWSVWLFLCAIYRSIVDNKLSRHICSDGTIYRIVSNIAILRSYRGISLSR